MKLFIVQFHIDKITIAKIKSGEDFEYTAANFLSKNLPIGAIEFLIIEVY